MRCLPPQTDGLSVEGDDVEKISSIVDVYSCPDARALVEVVLRLENFYLDDIFIKPYNPMDANGHNLQPLVHILLVSWPTAAQQNPQRQLPGTPFPPASCLQSFE